MAIFMDLHIVPGITARGAAEAHRQDLLIQSKYNCNCMTYWLDESNDRAFCLIEAPNAEAVIELHNEAHGLMTHQIIEVNSSVVESFLGRIYDPEISDLAEGDLKIFNDPAFRVLLLIRIADPSMLAYRMGNGDCKKYIRIFRDHIQHISKEFRGEIAEHTENVSAILSFKSATNAIDAALSLIESLSEKEKEILDLKISINSGLPVTGSKKIFGDTIELGVHLLDLAGRKPIVLSSSVSGLLQNQFLIQHRKNIESISAADEKVLNKLMNILELYGAEEKFSVKDMCQHMAVSKSSLNRITQTLTGTTPNNLLREFRLNKAYQLLKKDSENISQVAFLTGFSSPSYFSRCFKEHFHLSPSELVALVAR